MSVRGLTFALACEGEGDKVFLRILIERAAAAWLAESSYDADVLPGVDVQPRPKDYAFLNWLRQAEKIWPRTDLVVVHQDADNNSPESLYDSRWGPWLRVASEPDRWVLAVPVRTSEAWMLADYEVLAEFLRIGEDKVRRVLGNRRRCDEIGDPRGSLVELLGSSRRKPDFDHFSEFIAYRLRLAALRQRSSSFRKFEVSLGLAMAKLFSRPESALPPG